METREFRRSTGLDAGEDMVQSGDWAEVYVHPIAGQAADECFIRYMNGETSGDDAVLGPAVTSGSNGADTGDYLMLGPFGT